MDLPTQSWSVDMKCTNCNKNPARKATLLCKVCEAMLPEPCNDCKTLVDCETRHALKFRRCSIIRCFDCYKKEEIKRKEEEIRQEEARIALELQLRNNAIASIAKDIVEQPLVFAKRFLDLEEKVKKLVNMYKYR